MTMSTWISDSKLQLHFKKKKTSQLTSKGRFLKIDSLYGAPLEKTMTRMIYWNWETAKMAKFSREATGSSSSVHTSSPQYLVIVFSTEITLLECVNIFLT